MKPEPTHLKFRTLHTHSTLIDDAEKRTKLDRARVKKWAAELNFDMEGLI